MPAKFVRDMSGVLVLTKRQTGGPVRRLGALLSRGKTGSLPPPARWP